MSISSGGTVRRKRLGTRIPKIFKCLMRQADTSRIFLSVVKQDRQPRLAASGLCITVGCCAQVWPLFYRAGRVSWMFPYGLMWAKRDGESGPLVS